MNNEQILTQIKDKMDSLGMSQKTLSEKTLIDRPAISRILNGTTNWTKDTIIKILKAVKLNDLITLLK